MLLFQHNRICVLAVWTTVAAAQTPKFDVASVKAIPPPVGSYRADFGTASHGQLTLMNVTFSECVRYAFSINNDYQIAGPNWIKSRQYLFDIIGRSPAETQGSELRAMLQALLAERFHLEAHREPREIQHLELSIAKKGSKLKEADSETGTAANSGVMGRIISTGLPMSELAALLSRFLRLPVLDATGLPGAYDVRLIWTPDQVAPTLEPSEYPELFTAIRDQLGLALQSRKSPVDVIVVDRAEKIPIEN
jgi:uncharacterized protein (TIGR03435 family)